MNIKNQNRLSIFLGVEPAVISRIANRRAGISADMIIRIHETTDLPVAYIKELAGIPKFKENKEEECAILF